MNGVTRGGREFNGGPKEEKMKLPVDYTKLSVAQRREVREEYIKRQKGKCYYCAGSLNDLPGEEVMELEVDDKLFPPSFFDYPVHLHHDHSTNMTLGAVHCRCNAVLWQYLGE